MATDEIDLYGNIEDDYVEETNDFIELYDDAVQSQSKSSSKIGDTSDQLSDGPPKYSGLRVSAYVGNLTWWTTDMDVIESLKSIGVDDVIEIKFHENRQNGQSKGFCVVVFASNRSFDLAKISLPKIEIHGRSPMVTNCNRSNLALFDKSLPSTEEKSFVNNNSANNSFIPNPKFTPTSNGLFNSVRNQQSFNSQNNIRSNNLSSNTALNLPPPGFGNFLPSTSLPPPGLNPLAMNLPISNALPLPAMQRNIIDTYPRSGISESEFDDILQRNKTVASTAIHRAVQDASSGDSSNAISTLKTAISLIKQSKISEDDRCKLLINSLSDTLSGIETKYNGKSSYHKSSSRRRRSYSGSNSDEEYRRSRRRSRSRSRGERHTSRRYKQESDRGSSGRVEYFGANGQSSSSSYRGEGRSYR